MLFIDTHCRFQELFNAPVGGNVTSLQQSATTAEIIHVNKNVTMVQTTFNSPAHLFLYSVSHAALGSKKYDTNSHLLLTQAHIHTSHHKSYTNIQWKLNLGSTNSFFFLTFFSLHLHYHYLVGHLSCFFSPASKVEKIDMCGQPCKLHAEHKCNTIVTFVHSLSLWIPLTFL